MLHALGLRPGLLETVDMRTADIGGVGDDRGDCGVDLRLEAEVLGVEVNEGIFIRCGEGFLRPWFLVGSR